MKCPNCSAECSDQANACEFCGQAFVSDIETPPISEVPVAGPPPIPDFASPPPLPDALESDNPYASSGSSYGQPQIPYLEIPNHLALSITAAILSFCCCCIPFGIVPVIFSTQVNSKLAMGDYAGAQSSADNAKLWSWVCIGIALATRALSALVNLAGFATELGK